MNKVLTVLKSIFEVIYKIILILLKLAYLNIRKLYRYLKTVDYGWVGVYWNKLHHHKLFLKYKYIIALILVLLPTILVVTGNRNSVFGPNPTLNNVISNDFSDLEETKKLDKNIEKFMRRWEIVGASLAIMKNDKLVYCKGYGYADKEKEELCDVKHIFRLASISKLITAVAIMKLKEEGKLSLNSKVFGEKGILNEEQFLNIKDKRVKNITVEHLLRHNSGFSTRGGDPMFTPSMITYKLGKKPPFTMDDVVEYASQSSLRFNPGNGSNYSNLGYVVLSKIIEKVSGMEYERYIKNNIFAPIGCYDIHIANNSYKDKYRNEVKYYEPSNETMFEDEDGNLIPKSNGGNDVRLLSGAGAWVGSPIEILKFVASIDGNPGVKDILSPSSIKYMTAEKRGCMPIGWIRTNNSEWSRTGSMSGTSAMIKCNHNGYTWMLVTNTSSWKGSKFTNQINSSVRQALNSVKSWPKRDIFEIADSIMGR